MSAEKYIPNILIVDDIAANLKVLGGILREEGYKVRPVPSGQLALRAAQKEKPDLILLDIMMPEMDGYEVCRQLKATEELSNIPVIFISALNDTNDLIKAFQAGGVDYITKPFQAEEVLARVATHLKICRQANELRELIAVKDKFFSIIAHDLRGPIGNILLISESISEKGKLDEDTLYSFIEMQRELSEETFQLLGNLLNWARANTNQIEFYPTQLNLQDVISDCLKGINIQRLNKEISVSETFKSEIPVWADENMLRLILRNLLSNAIKFTPRGGSITIRTSDEKSGMVTISIQDTGIGIPAEILGNLFRIDVNNKRHGTEGEGSNGLGLILCKELVEKNGGSIWVESTEGQGTTFSFDIPGNN